MNFDSILKKRSSIRKYSPKKISLAEVLKIAEAARYSPMAGNFPVLKIIIVGNQKKKSELAEAAAKQYFIADSSYIIVVCSEIKKLERSYEKRAEKYSKQQAGAAIQNMLLKTTELGLASCWIGAFDENAVRTVLNIPENVEVEALLPIGKEAKKIKSLKQKQRKKPELKSMTFFEKWGQTEFKPDKRIEAI